jgi:AraC family transcriptional regulator
LAEIAAVLKQAVERRRAHGSAGGTAARVLARGAGWSVADVVCTSGPGDRPFEEQHRNFGVAVVVAGSFQYRTSTGRALLAPGSLMLGNAGHVFCCGHAHDTGDRCISFSYAPDYYERLTGDAGAPAFHVAALPPVRAMSAAVARVCAGLAADGMDEFAWEELGVRIAVKAARLANGTVTTQKVLPSAEGRVTRVVRRMEEMPAARHSLARLAEAARLSPYHFLRTFQRVVGLTPHQYVLRMRLRRAAARLVQEETSVLEIALDCGFGDVSNFNRSFRTEFGRSPRAFRRSELCPRTDSQFRD